MRIAAAVLVVCSLFLTWPSELAPPDPRAGCLWLGLPLGLVLSRLVAWRRRPRLAAVCLLAVLSLPAQGQEALLRKREMGHLVFCRGNLRNIVTAAEMYRADHHRYPKTLRELQPDYLGGQTLPTCPAALQETYSGSYRPAADGFVVFCKGHHHKSLGIAADRPGFKIAGDVTQELKDATLERVLLEWDEDGIDKQALPEYRKLKARLAEKEAERQDVVRQLKRLPQLTAEVERLEAEKARLEGELARLKKGK